MTRTSSTSLREHFDGTFPPPDAVGSLPAYSRVVSLDKVPIAALWLPYGLAMEGDYLIQHLAGIPHAGV